MKVYQREIIEVPFNLEQGVRHHLAIVLSSNVAIEQEGAFIALMITSDKSFDDEFTYELTNSMIEGGKGFTKSYNQARLHLISYFKESDVIINSYSKMKIKEADFKRILKRIWQVTFEE